MSKLPVIFSGTVSYTNKRIAELRRQGYTVTWSKLWSDGKYTYRMEYNEY